MSATEPTSGSLVWQVFSLALGVIIALIGALWKTLTVRISRLENAFGINKDESTKVIYTSATRIDGIVTSMSEMKETMRRLEDKFDSFSKRA